MVKGDDTGVIPEVVPVKTKNDLNYGFIIYKYLLLEIVEGIFYVNLQNVCSNFRRLVI